MLGYDLEAFEPVIGEWPELPLEVANELEALGSNLEELPVTGQEEIVLRWQRVNASDSGPYRLALTLKPEVKEYVDESGVRTSFGYQVINF